MANTASLGKLQLGVLHVLLALPLDDFMRLPDIRKQMGHFQSMDTTMNGLIKRGLVERKVGVGCWLYRVVPSARVSLQPST